MGSTASHSFNEGEGTQGVDAANDPSEGPQQKRRRMTQVEGENPPEPSQVPKKKKGGKQSKGAKGSRTSARKLQAELADQTNEQRTRTRKSGMSCESWFSLAFCSITYSTPNRTSVRCLGASMVDRVKLESCLPLGFIGYSCFYSSMAA